jgi:hypothetical protein
LHFVNHIKVIPAAVALIVWLMIKVQIYCELWMDLLLVGRQCFADYVLDFLLQLKCARILARLITMRKELNNNFNQKPIGRYLVNTIRWTLAVPQSRSA